MEVEAEVRVVDVFPMMDEGHHQAAQVTHWW